MKLYGDLGATQRTAWFELKRSCATFTSLQAASFKGALGTSNRNLGGLRTAKHEYRKLKSGRGTVGEVAGQGVNGRKPGLVRTMDVENSTAAPDENCIPDSAGYKPVNHSVVEWCRGARRIQFTTFVAG